MVQSIAKKDQSRIQMESDLKEKHGGCLQGLPEAMVLSPLQRAFQAANGRFPGVEGKVVSLCFIHKLFGQRNK